MSTMPEKRKIQYWEELSKVASALAFNCSKLLKHEGKVYGNMVDGGELWYTEFPEVFDTKDEMKLEPVNAYLAKNLLVNLETEFPEFRKIEDWRKLTKNHINTDIINILHMVSHRKTFSENCEVSLSWKHGSVVHDTVDALNKFLILYPKGTTHDFYKCYLTKSIPPLELSSTSAEIQDFIDHRCGKKNITPGGRNAYFRAIRCFINWAYSPASGLELVLSDNPITWVKPPKVDEKIMPAQDAKSFEVLLTHVSNTRDRAIICTLIDSSGRLSEISNIHENDILWEKHMIKAIAKGGREVLMPLSVDTEILLRDWLAEYHPNGGSIWGITKGGIVSMLRRLERSSGVKCNAHTFRRGFASILRRKGVDTLDIMKLGHWKSMSMVKKYTESVDFEDSQKHYKAPTERLADAAGGLQKDGVVPRPRIELGTRGFSVHCSTN